MRRGLRGGFGPGRGCGFGRRFPENQGRYDYGYPQGPTNEREMLKTEAKAMQESLEAVLKRIKELEADSQK